MRVKAGAPHPDLPRSDDERPAPAKRPPGSPRARPASGLRRRRGPQALRDRRLHRATRHTVAVLPDNEAGGRGRATRRAAGVPVVTRRRHGHPEAIPARGRRAPWSRRCAVCSSSMRPRARRRRAGRAQRAGLGGPRPRGCSTLPTLPAWCSIAHVAENSVACTASSTLTTHNVRRCAASTARASVGGGGRRLMPGYTLRALVTGSEGTSVITRDRAPVAPPEAPRRCSRPSWRRAAAEVGEIIGAASSAALR